MNKALLILCAALPLLAGCGSGSGATSGGDEDALKAKLDKPLGSVGGKAPPAGESQSAEGTLASGG